MSNKHWERRSTILSASENVSIDTTMHQVNMFLPWILYICHSYATIALENCANSCLAWLQCVDENKFTHPLFSVHSLKIPTSSIRKKSRRKGSKGFSLDNLLDSWRLDNWYGWGWEVSGLLNLLWVWTFGDVPAPQWNNYPSGYFLWLLANSPTRL